MNKNSSQLGQDLWILEKTDFKKNGFFVEAGSCDGILMSNTYLLEKKYSWNGICCEPARGFHKELRQNRDCNVCHLLLYEQSGLSKTFYESRAYGGIPDYFYKEGESYKSLTSLKDTVSDYELKTISLNDMLDKFNAPKNIDYVSLDTEGSELDILRGFDFSKRNVLAWSVEHNTNDRSDQGAYLCSLIDIMRKHGYDYEHNKWDIYFYKI